MPHRLTILPWDRPLLERAVAHFSVGWSGGALDLSDWLIVVPTRQAGRRLREALAVQAATKGGAVLAPRVVPPEEVLDLAEVGVAHVATRAQAMVAWVAVLQSAELERLRAVFPLDPPRRSFAWALQLAEELVRLQSVLAEGGLRFADVPARAGEACAERERWEQLGDLERACDARLAEAGAVAQPAARIAAAAAPASLPAGVRRIALLGVADPLLPVVQVLETWSRSVPVEVLVCGPAGGEVYFDEWGRPRPEVWTVRTLPLPEFERRVHLCADPAAQAEAVAGLVRRAAGQATPGIGCADAEVLPLLAGPLAEAGVTSFVPAGEPLARQALAGLIQVLQTAARDESWAAVAALLRRPEVLRWLEGAPSAGFSATGLLRAVDEIEVTHLPPDLAAVRHQASDFEGRCAGLAAALERVAVLLEKLRTGAWPQAWNSALAELHGGRELDLAEPADRALVEAATAWREAADEVTAALVGGDMAGVKPAPPSSRPSPPAVASSSRGEQARPLQAAEACELARKLFAAGRRFDDKPEGALEIDGWLELLFRDERWLVVAGLNDGAVPEAVHGHAFLPESLRAALGLKTNAQRLARDAWQLAALAAARAERGRLDLLLGKTSAAGDPLRPSRLLFLCAETELPGRVERLFRELPPVGGTVAWRRAWTLAPPWVPPPPRLRVTAFRDYLKCPFRFYLRHVLKMEPVEAGKRELDARDFGVLVHGVLERLGQETAWRDCIDAGKLTRYFHEALDGAVAARLGRELTLPLIVQVESARQRLAQVAQVQAATRAEGWVIQHVEWRLPKGKLRLGRLELSGTIDRIERHEPSGRWRVLDYKTSESAKTPAKAHLVSARSAGGVATLAEATVEAGGKAWRWIDLQLPLYRLAVGELLGAPEVEVGYFNVPKAVSETGIEVWAEYDAALHAAAMRCAEEVATAAMAGRFWPPVEEVRDDEFTGLIHGSVAESFDVSAWPEAARRGGAA